MLKISDPSMSPIKSFAVTCAISVAIWLAVVVVVILPRLWGH